MAEGVTRRGFFAFCGAATATTLFPALELPAKAPVTDVMLRDFYLTEISAIPLESVVADTAAMYSKLGGVFAGHIVEELNRPSPWNKIFQVESVGECPSTSTDVSKRVSWYYEAASECVARRAMEGDPSIRQFVRGK